VGERQAEQRAGDDEAAGEERRLGAAALADPPNERRDQERGEPTGGEQEAGLGGREPEADLAALRQLAELGDEDEGADHRRADQQGGDVRRQHGPAGEGRHVHQGLAGASLEEGEQGEPVEADEHEGGGLGGGPAPVGAAGDGDEQAGQGDA
jgi:hypothetical protein